MMAQCGALSVCHDVTLRICKRPLIFHDRPSMLPVAHGLARILERQKMLQTDQVLLRRLSVNFALLLPFKDSQGGTSSLELSDLKGILFAGTPQWKRKRSMLIAPRHSPSHQILGPAISEAAGPRCSTPSAIKLPDTPRRSEAPPR